ncbi:MAG: LTA synthase family protein [Planctomycetes bacterium]|nr:LTA synthase family protein [Planctomycetota bacterium]
MRRPSGRDSDSNLPDDDNGAGRPGPLARWLGHPPVRLIVLLAAAMIVLFAAQRGVLILLGRERLGPVAAADMVRLFAAGLRHDLHVLAWLALPLVLLLTLAPARPCARRWHRRGVVGYLAAVVMVTVGICVVDTLFFVINESRINWQVPDYLFEKEIAAHVWRHYPVVGLLVGIVALVIGVVRLASLCCPVAAPPRTPAWGRAIGAASALVLVLGWTFAPRMLNGRPATSPYFCSNSLVIELAQNPLSTSGYAVMDYLTEGGRAEPYPRPDGGLAALRDALRQGHTTFADNAANPLWRTVRTGRPRSRPNVVLVIMESFTGRHVGAMAPGREASRTPFFDSLADQGLFFTHMYAAGSRTNRALAALLCGFPDIGGRSILRRQGARQTFPSLFDAFAERGYRTLFICGSNAEFDDMETFFRQAGVQEVVDIDGMPADAWRSTWAVGDHMLFDVAAERLDAVADEGPFFAVILTTTNHRPYELPPDAAALCGCDGQAAPPVRTLRYADWAMERFMEQMRHSDGFDNTLFVFVADHSPAPDPRRFVDVEGYRVPCLLYGPALKGLEPRRVGTPCSQMDLMPTLLSFLGGEFSHGTFGRDLLALEATDPGLAFLRQQRATALVRGDEALVLLPHSDPLLLQCTADGRQQPLDTAARGEAQPMHRLAFGVYETARGFLMNGTYGSGADVAR